MILLGLWVLPLMISDMLLTIWSIKLFRKYKPRHKEWWEGEANDMVVGLWKKYGLAWGSAIALEIQLVLLIIILVFVNMNGLMFMFGMYTLLFYLHLTNILFFKDKLKCRKDEQGVKGK